MVFLWAPIYITRQPGYQIQIRFEMWRDLNCECLFIRTNLIVHKGNGAEISEFSKGFVRRVKWKGPLNWIDHQKSLRFLTAVSSCLLPYYIGTIPILRQQKEWVGGLRKWSVLLTFSTVFMLIMLIYADGWGSKRPKICWHNIGMVPYVIFTYCAGSMTHAQLDDHLSYPTGCLNNHLNDYFAWHI